MLNKPIYAGLAILEESKLHMYKFYYDVLKPKYKNNIELGYTDTDSFIIKVNTEDVYEDFKELNYYMDFSDYPKDHPNYDNSNKKVLGKFKDELNGKIMTEFIGLKPKMYAYKVEDNNEFKKAKGIPKKCLKRDLNFENYRKTLEENENKEVSFNCIRSFRHEIYSIECNKQGLSNYDNKRYYINNDVSYPHGHYMINQSINNNSCLA